MPETPKPPKRQGRKPAIATNPEADEFLIACAQWVAAALDAADVSAADLRRDYGIREADVSEFRSAKREPTLRVLAKLAAATGHDARPLILKLTRLAQDEIANPDSPRATNANA